ncbi:MAG: hypothetical protein QNL62_13915, partial [Gammaproteobacteria bacterium]|nr:hypothetical protein [Gammaproteobacteria bacterium]
MKTKTCPAGYDVLQEAVELLKGLEFSVQEGVTVSGESLRLVIAPRWNGVDAYRLLMTCFVYGDRKVDWANMPVHLVATTGAGSPVFVFRVNPRGQAIIDGISPGEYRMSVSKTYFGGSNMPIILPRENQEQLAASGVQTGDKWPEKLLTCVSNDSRLRAVPQTDANGNITITFEANDESLANGRVRFSVIKPTGKVVISHECVLEKNAHTGE